MMWAEVLALAARIDISQLDKLAVRVYTGNCLVLIAAPELNIQSLISISARIA
jgi:hypothetical protein